MNKWLTKEIIKLMKKRGRSITNIEINERSVYSGSIPIIEVEFTDVDSGIFFSEQILINTEADSFEDILNDVELEIESFLKREGIA